MVYLGQRRTLRMTVWALALSASVQIACVRRGNTPADTRPSSGKEGSPGYEVSRGTVTATDGADLALGNIRVSFQPASFVQPNTGYVISAKVSVEVATLELGSDAEVVEAAILLLAEDAETGERLTEEHLRYSFSFRVRMPVNEAQNLFVIVVDASGQQQLITDSSLTMSAVDGATSEIDATTELRHIAGPFGLYTGTPPDDGLPSVGLSAICPESGALSGRSLVTIDGAGFTENTVVSVGGQSCIHVEFISSSQLICETPAGHAAGATTIVLEQEGVILGERTFTYEVEAGWVGVATKNAPPVGEHFKSVWMGCRAGAMILGGSVKASAAAIPTAANAAHLFSPATNTWKVAAAYPDDLAPVDTCAVSLGASGAFVFGGKAAAGGNAHSAIGYRYNPTDDEWFLLSEEGRPSARVQHTCVYIPTLHKVMVWGGRESGGSAGVATGALYDIATDRWIATPTIAAPTGRYHHIAIWTGSEVIIFGGQTNVGTAAVTGWRYDPSSNEWRGNIASNAHAILTGHIGSEFYRGSMFILTTGLYNFEYELATDEWSSSASDYIPLSGAVAAAGSRMFHFGGQNLGTANHKLIKYDYAANEVSEVDGGRPPTQRQFATMVWTGSRLLVWGGRSSSGISEVSYAADGGMFR